MSIQIQLMTLTCFSLSVSWDSFHGQFLNFGFSPQGALVFWQCEHHATTSHTCNFSSMTLKAGAMPWSKQREQGRDKS
jgi:hypothetical protein